MLHTRPPRSYHWCLSVCPTVAPSLASQRRRNGYEVSIGRRWRLSLRQRLLQIACKSRAPWGLQQNCKSLGPILSDLRLCGLEFMDHPSYSLELAHRSIHKSQNEVFSIIVFVTLLIECSLYTEVLPNTEVV